MILPHSLFAPLALRSNTLDIRSLAMLCYGSAFFFRVGLVLITLQVLYSFDYDLPSLGWKQR